MSWKQRAGLTLICVGCILKQMGGRFDVKLVLDVPMRAYALLALQIVANVVAGVANELLLKEKGSAPLNIQNMVQYSWTLLWCLLTGLVCPLEGVSLNPFDLEEWMKMSNRWMLPNLVAFAVMGLITAVLLKQFNSVAKAAMTASELFLTAGASALLFGPAMGFADLCAIVVAATGGAVYALAPPPASAIADARPASQRSPESVELQQPYAEKLRST
eukprot:gnl/TRDRNA2_/TRDRNA2_83358_c0_seq2.p1 gnl/TRDRNA2_/TRDRNA2_83358_c0~~gnl/TRDRNA2_/TRDRNA2_83358_c0_seq2.p1  ORF type:complete len:217 (+),score=52.39 gnl/TRDRNA2_/TRDRNA2_83358_c0_seq2:330-980(+)